MTIYKPSMLLTKLSNLYTRLQHKVNPETKLRSVSPMWKLSHGKLRIIDHCQGQACLASAVASTRTASTWSSADDTSVRTDTIAGITDRTSTAPTNDTCKNQSGRYIYNYSCNHVYVSLRTSQPTFHVLFRQWRVTASSQNRTSL